MEMPLPIMLCNMLLFQNSLSSEVNNGRKSANVDSLQSPISFAQEKHCAASVGTFSSNTMS